MNLKSYQIAKNKQQHGIVLVVSLIMLLMITLLAMTGMRATSMEERMAGNSRNGNISFQMAEAALREVETFIEATASSAKSVTAARARTVFSSTAGKVDTYAGANCFIPLGSVDFYQQTSWATACVYTGTADDALAKAPQFFIEFLYADSGIDPLNPTPGKCVYQITARGYGADATAATVRSNTTLQSTYKFAFCS